MSPSTLTRTPTGLDARVLARVVEEGYGPGAWHGPDLRAALEDVTPALAFWRPAKSRHNIAEIALHHAYCIRNARGKLAGAEPEPFALEGDDWFPLSDGSPLSWPDVRSLLEREQSRLAAVLADIAEDRSRTPLGETEAFDLALGIACHAVYHAGQIQLIKRLAAG